MLIIRFQRVGKKNMPSFRLVLAEKQRAVKKQFVELLGHYNPRTKEFGLKSPERLQYWIKQHVSLSPTVHNLFVTKGILSDKKVEAWKPKKKEKAEGAATPPAQPKQQEKTEGAKTEQVKEEPAAA